MINNKFGFQNLAKKSLAVVTAALSVFSHTKAEVPNNTNHEIENDKNIPVENTHKNVLKPKLVLKLNIMDPSNSLVSMHSSHSSHRSHSSHSSHSSHYSSSYSSGSSYTPSPTPVYVPASSSSSGHSTSGGTVKSTPGTNSTGKSSGATPFYNPGAARISPSNRTTDAVHVADSSSLKLGDRVLFKGCEGKDVEVLQRILMTLKKDMFITGYFGLQTEAIIIHFQQENELRPDGKVDAKTLNVLRNKANEISTR
ncbi:hypothetical protein QFZ51_005390 [Chitinophaga sp. W3I9]|uniref:peptidoglycan-binding domain-containing protein n=1 Tax=unclassified Chitinophaga TaxID=2619133 RepID=UPI003D19D31C